ncbi:hypothetical protein B0H15DRAFT_55621 [Mycena belliarum]|uniref:Uncharacterized protein n=1 Tax=Mycena belliarum TaxID=1033014 RepID=A0AAD6XSP0_9AGAR|nr:hypothetical protein B0H15DRAFT_55621 [Mycena belliae]
MDGAFYAFVDIFALHPFIPSPPPLSWSRTSPRGSEIPDPVLDAHTTYNQCTFARKLLYFLVPFPIFPFPPEVVRAASWFTHPTTLEVVHLPPLSTSYTTAPEVVRLPPRLTHTLPRWRPCICRLSVLLHRRARGRAFAASAYPSSYRTAPEVVCLPPRLTTAPLPCQCTCRLSLPFAQSGPSGRTEGSSPTPQNCCALPRSM